MAGHAAPNRDAAATPSATASNGQILRQQQTPPTTIRRHLPFASMKPPFVSPDEYHRFSTPARSAAAADHPPEAIVIKSPVRFAILSQYLLFHCCLFAFCLIFLILAFYCAINNFRVCNYFVIYLIFFFLNADNSLVKFK